MRGTKSNLFQRLIKASWDSIRPTRSPFYLFYLNFMLCWQKQKSSGLYNSLRTNSYTNGIQYTDMYANLRQPNMRKINCLKTNSNVTYKYKYKYKDLEKLK